MDIKRLMCDRCHKRIAMVFITKMENGVPKKQALCLKCARELGMDPTKDLATNFGIDEKQLEAMSEEISNMMADSPDGDFSLGGALSLDPDNKIFDEIQGGEDENQPAENNEKHDGKKRGEPKNTPHKTRFLGQFCKNLTKAAAEGKLDNVIGREKEVERVLQILSRRTKNNPCLIGEPGVGKTAIAEGIAIKIANKEIPAKLANKQIYLLDLTALIAGTQFRGQFESRVKGLIEEVKAIGNIILVIDEVHSLVGTGDAEGSMNAANMLKPALSRGEIQVIGATTLKEYRKYIEKDAALERRFQPVMVNEPSIEESIEMIRGIKAYYEKFHNIKIPMLIAERAVEMSERYVNDRFLPDKAIDLIDEACSNAVLKNPIYDEFFKLGERLNTVKKEAEALEAKEEKEEADYQLIAEARSEELRLKAAYDELSEKITECTVTFDDLAAVIELWTGIPASKIKEGEYAKLRGLENELKKHIVGQDTAVEAVANAVKRGRISLVPRKRPVSFIFSGPTGVGKTELVKVLASELFNSPETLIRLDMSEFMEKHAVSRLIGSPPGYVGYDEAGQLTEKIRRKPYSVILFDEIEKAHPDVLNILLQILDDGILTDSHGRKVSFEHALIVMTTNAGSNIRGGEVGFNKSVSVVSAEKTKKALREFLRPEFLNRVDEIITFNPLGKELFADIVKIRLEELRSGLVEREIELVYDDAVLNVLADMSYSSEYGARNVRRIVQKEIEDKVVSVMCESDMIPKKITVSADGEKLKVEVE